MKEYMKPQLWESVCKLDSALLSDIDVPIGSEVINSEIPGDEW